MFHVPIGSPAINNDLNDFLPFIDLNRMHLIKHELLVF